MDTNPTVRRIGVAWLDGSRNGRPMPARTVLRLQQTIGNREVRRLLSLAPSTALVPGASAPVEHVGLIRQLVGRFWRRG